MTSTKRGIAALLTVCLLLIASCTSPEAPTDPTTTTGVPDPTVTAPPPTMVPTTDPPTGAWPRFGQMDIAATTDSQSRFDGNGQPGSVRFVCYTSHILQEDPLVFPGEQRKGHVHMFFGNTLADRNSTAESLRTTGDGTCQGGPLNRTGYWAPVMYDTNGDIRLPQYILVYYKAGPLAGRETISRFPEGLAMIAGNGQATRDQSDRIVKWNCGFPGNYPTLYSFGATIPDCKPGDFVTGSIAFPPCWDGENLTSADNKSHMAYPIINGRCPATHPVGLPQVTYNMYFNNGDQSTKEWRLSSDLPGTPGGTSLHADWIGAWHPEVQDLWIRNCSNASHDCKGGTISADQRLAGPFNTGINVGLTPFNPNQQPEIIPG